jgi:poly-beta-1,6-N-acetyl-D-glucosamine synthase
MIAVIFWLCIVFIVYTYVGYPLVLYLLAKTRKKKATYPPYQPTVTLLIAAYNEETWISRKLDNALESDYPSDKLQILVVADGSDDSTPEIIRSYQGKNVELCFQPVRQGKMEAINRAIEYVTGQVVVFSDANNMYEAGTLSALVQPFSDPTVGGVSGAKHVIKGDDPLSESEGLYWKYESFIKKQETLLGSCSGVSGEIFAIRRSLFEPALKGIINDDFYLAMRLLSRGYRIIYTPLARSYERVSLSKEDEIIRRTRINAGRYQALRFFNQIFPKKYPILMWQVFSHKVFRLLIPFGMIGAFVASLFSVIPIFTQSGSSFLRLTGPFNWILLALQCVFYLLAWIGNAKNGKPGKILYLPTFLVNSNLAALQGFIRFLSGRETALWKRVRRADDGNVIHG